MTDNNSELQPEETTPEDNANQATPSPRKNPFPTDTRFILDPHDYYTLSISRNITSILGRYNDSALQNASYDRSAGGWKWSNYKDFIEDIETAYDVRDESGNMSSTEKSAEELEKFVLLNGYASCYAPGPTAGTSYTTYRYSGYSRIMSRNAARRLCNTDHFAADDYSFYKSDDYSVIKMNPPWEDAEAISEETETATYYLSKYNKYTIAGETVYSKIPLEFISYIGQVLDLTSIASQPSTYEFDKILASKQNPNARTNKFANWQRMGFGLGEMSDVVFASEDTVVSGTEFKYSSVIAAMGTQLKTISFDAVYRGSQGIAYSKKIKRSSSLFKGTSLVLFKTKYKLLNQDTLELEDAVFINVLITAPPEKVLKYRRTLAFFPAFLRKIFDENGLAFFNPEEYEKRIRERFSGNCTYHNRVEQIFGQYVQSNPSIPIANTSFLSNESLVSDKDMRHFTSYSEFQNTPAIARYSAAKDAYHRVQESVKEAQVSLNAAEQQLLRSNERLASYRAYIEEAERDIEIYKKKKKEANDTVEGYTPALVELKSEVESLEETKESLYQAFLSDTTSQECNSTFIANLAKSGIIVEEVTYFIPSIEEIRMAHNHSDPELTQDMLDKMFGSENGLFSLKRHPAMALSARLRREDRAAQHFVRKVYNSHEIPEEEEDSTLYKAIYQNLVDCGYQEGTNHAQLILESGCIPRIHTIRFRTEKPVIIKVDYAEKGERCKKRVGGPYQVEIQFAKDRISMGYGSYAVPQWVSGRQLLNVRFTNTEAVFGWDSSTSSMWTHPHSQNRYVDTQNWQSFERQLSTWTSGCLGDIAPSINSAYQEGDIKVAIFAAMSWLTSANSSDTWGRYHTKFPLLSEVNMNGTSLPSEEDQTEQMLTTEEGMEENVLGLIETLGETLSEEDCINVTFNMEDVEQEVVEEDLISILTEQPQAAPATEEHISTPNVRRRYVPYAEIVQTRTTGLEHIVDPNNQ